MKTKKTTKKTTTGKTTRKKKKEKTKVITMSTGSYPRIGDTEELQKLRRAWSKRETGEINEEEFESVVREFIELAIREQEKAGIDIVTDGTIRWYDQISHLAKAIEGVKINGLLRFFDTNTYFRQPVLQDVPDNPKIELVTLEDFRFAKSIAKKDVKPILTGPVTLAKLSKGDFKKSLEIYTRLVENEVRALSEEGAKYIQIDEPALTGKDIDGEFSVLPYLERIYKAKSQNTSIIYFFYFRDFSKDWKKFQKIPADILGFDMTYSRLEDVIAKEGTKKPLLLGVFDGRSTYIEKPKDVIPRVKKVLKNYPFDFIMIGPSCGLEYLPRKFAYEKLKAVSRISKILKNGK